MSWSHIYLRSLFLWQFEHNTPYPCESSIPQYRKFFPSSPQYRTKFTPDTAIPQTPKYTYINGIARSLLVFLSSRVRESDSLTNRSLRYCGARSLKDLYIIVDVSFKIISLVFRIRTDTLQMSWIAARVSASKLKLWGTVDWQNHSYSKVKSK